MNTKIKTLIIILLAFLPLIGIFSKTVEQSPQSPVVTPVSGPSWLKRLGLRPGETAMGRMGGRSSAPPSIFMQPGENTPEPEKSFLRHMRNVLRNIFSLFKKNRKASQNLLQKTFILSGSDLYRLNCQSCHGPDGTGAPPEIKSLIDPVRGMSPTLIMKRIEERGRPIDEAFARELASQAEATLRQRLQEGGEKMPPFKHLSGDEVEALIEYLKELAGLPEEERHEIKVTQSVARVGEHLIKGTCHICHDATGPGGGHMAMMRGIIPSLASFVRQNSIQQVVRQVKMGSSRMMYMMGRDTMPAFPYLSEEEIIAGYLYLVEYPPRP